MKRFILLAPFAACLFSCAMYATMVRGEYSSEKLAQASTSSNVELFKNSDFKSYASIKTSLQSDFDMRYFRSVDYHYYYYSYPVSRREDFVVNSSLIMPGENLVFFGNLFSDYMSSQDGRVTLRFYLIEKNKEISRDLILELGMPESMMLKPGQYKSSDTGGGEIAVAIKNGKHATLYSIEPNDGRCFVQIDAEPIASGIISAKLTASLKSPLDGSYYTIKDGQIWFRQ